MNTKRFQCVPMGCLAGTSNGHERALIVDVQEDKLAKAKQDLIRGRLRL